MNFGNGKNNADDQFLYNWQLKMNLKWKYNKSGFNKPLNLEETLKNDILRGSKVNFWHTAKWWRQGEVDGWINLFPPSMLNLPVLINNYLSNARPNDWWTGGWLKPCSWVVHTPGWIYCAVVVITSQSVWHCQHLSLMSDIESLYCRTQFPTYVSIPGLCSDVTSVS